MTKPSENLQAMEAAAAAESPFVVTVMSFGYKEGPAPAANVVFDVRFLKNPYWIEELRPLTGLDVKVQQYVLEQELAQEFLSSMETMLTHMLPRLRKFKVSEFSIAFGCTGGQHRSATIVETLASRLVSLFPDCKIVIEHRELSNRIEKQCQE